MEKNETLKMLKAALREAEAGLTPSINIVGPEAQAQTQYAQFNTERPMIGDVAEKHDQD